MEFDERIKNDGKLSQLGRFNVYQNGVRNVLTAGEHNKRIVDHFPVSRASRWKNDQNENIEMMSDMNPVQSTYGNVADEVRA